MGFMEALAADARVIADAAVNTASALLWVATLVLLTAFFGGLLYHLAGQVIMDWAKKRAEKAERRIAELESRIHEMEITVPHSTIIGLRDELSKAERRQHQSDLNYAALEKVLEKVEREAREFRDPGGIR